MRVIIPLLLRWVCIVPLVLILSCTNLSLKMDMISPQSEAFLMAYKKAMIVEAENPQEACYIYTQLSTQDFALKTLSLLKAHLTCQDFQSLAPVPLSLNSEQPWLAGLNYDRMIEEAKKSKDNAALAEAYLKKAMWSDRIREKVELLENARDFAKKAKDKNLIKDIQVRLYKIAPRFTPNPEVQDYVRVGSDLIYQREFSKGRNYLRKAFASKALSKDQQYLARKLYRNSYKVALQKSEYINAAKEFAEWTKKNGTPARIHEAYLLLARAQWTQGKITDAKKTLDTAEKLLKGKVSLEEIFYVRAKMAEEQLDFKKALEIHTAGEAIAKRKSAYHQRLLFSKAWALRKLERYAEAADSFKKLKEETEDNFEKYRLSFWYAKSLLQAGKTAEAKKEFEHLASEDALGYYGLIAYRELDKPIPALNLFKDSLEIWNRPRNVDSDEHQYIAALTYVDESFILEKFLNAKTLRLQTVGSQDETEWLYYLKAYARAGLFNPLFAQLGSLPSTVRSELLSQNPDLLFPRRYLDLIEDSAKKFSISSELMLSIIRQESAFNPHARSPADALGLMQVLPSVAEAHENNTGIKISHFEDLYKPDINIPVGASVLADLKRKYKGQFILTAAAYNANEKAIATWLETRLDKDPLEFIEDIPYEETRAYVKLVLRNFIFYSRLKTPAEPISFPSWCLEDLHSFKVSTR